MIHIIKLWSDRCSVYCELAIYIIIYNCFKLNNLSVFNISAVFYCTSVDITDHTIVCIEFISLVCNADLCHAVYARKIKVINLIYTAAVHLADCLCTVYTYKLTGKRTAVSCDADPLTARIIIAACKRIIIYRLIL